MNSESPYRRFFLLLLLFGAVLCFSDLMLYPLESGDETRVAGIAESMFRSGDWVIPRLNGTPFLEYPPLFYQASAACFHLFGVTEPAAKIPSALAGFLSALLLFWLMKRKGASPPASLAAGLLFLCTAKVFESMKTCRVDMLLSFFILLAWVGIGGFFDTEDRRKRILLFLAGAAGLCGGFMTKGPVGAVIPLASAGIWLIVTDVLDKKFRFVRYLWLVLMFLLSLCPVLFWYCEVYLHGGKQAFYTAAVVNTIGRFSGSQGDHVKSFWFYLPRIPVMFAPWFPLFLVPWAAVIAKKDGKLLRETLYCSLCFAVPLLLFSAAAGKREVYLLPLEAPAVLLAVKGMQLLLPCLQKKVTLSERAWTVVTTVLILLPLPVLGILTRVFPGECPVFLLLFFVLGFGCIPSGKYFRPVTFLWTFCTLILLTGAFFVRSKKAKYSLRPLFAECAALERAGYRTVLVRGSERTEGGANFYLRRNVPNLRLSGEKIRKGPPEGMLWILRSRDEERGRHFPDFHHILIGKKRTE